MNFFFGGNKKPEDKQPELTEEEQQQQAADHARNQRLKKLQTQPRDRAKTDPVSNSQDAVMADEEAKASQDVRMASQTSGNFAKPEPMKKAKTEIDTMTAPSMSKTMSSVSGSS